MPEPETPLVDKVRRLHWAFADAQIDHAFGGALALAYYTRDPRATADIDLNISLGPDHVELAFDALPATVQWVPSELAQARSNEQVRIWWGRTPIDLFFRASAFHDAVAARAELHPFGDELLPFLSAGDLCVFKALFDRPKDWIDIASMAQAGSLDVGLAVSELRALIGDDQRVRRLSALEASPREAG